MPGIAPQNNKKSASREFTPNSSRNIYDTPTEAESFIEKTEPTLTLTGPNGEDILPDMWSDISTVATRQSEDRKNILLAQDTKSNSIEGGIAHSLGHHLPHRRRSSLQEPTQQQLSHTVSLRSSTESVSSSDGTIFEEGRRISLMGIDESQIPRYRFLPIDEQGAHLPWNWVVQVMPVITVSVCGLLVTGYIMDIIMVSHHYYSCINPQKKNI